MYSMIMVMFYYGIAVTIVVVAVVPVVAVAVAGFAIRWWIYEGVLEIVPYGFSGCRSVLMDMDVTAIEILWVT